MGLFKQVFLNICQVSDKKCRILHCSGDNGSKSNCRNRKNILLTKKNVSVVGVRFVKVINRQIQVFKKVFQKKKGV